MPSATTVTHPPRLDAPDFTRTAPAVYAAMLALGKAVDDAGLEKELTELVKVRASQINGCAYCLQLHLDVARKAGVPQAKLDLVATWREAGAFSARECAALAWTEALTDVARQGAPDELHAQVAAQFPGAQLAFLTTAIATINAWNRIAVALRFAPRPAT